MRKMLVKMMTFLGLIIAMMLPTAPATATLHVTLTLTGYPGLYDSSLIDGKLVLDAFHIAGTSFGVTGAHGHLGNDTVTGTDLTYASADLYLSGPDGKHLVPSFSGLSFTKSNGDIVNIFTWPEGSYGPGQYFIFKSQSPDGDPLFALPVHVSSFVPEPANWALLIVGFGLIGAAARGQRLAANDNESFGNRLAIAA